MRLQSKGYNSDLCFLYFLALCLSSLWKTAPRYCFYRSYIYKDRNMHTNRGTIPIGNMSHLNCSWRKSILNWCCNFFQGSCHTVKEVYLKRFINDMHSQYVYGISLGWILSLFIFVRSHILVMLQSKFLILKQ